MLSIEKSELSPPKEDETKNVVVLMIMKTRPPFVKIAVCDVLGQ